MYFNVSHIHDGSSDLQHFYLPSYRMTHPSTTSRLSKPPIDLKLITFIDLSALLTMISRLQEKSHLILITIL